MLIKERRTAAALLVWSMTSNLTDEAPNSPGYVVNTRWALEGVLMVLVGSVGIIGRLYWGYIWDAGIGL